jgi:hypothetical protein
MLYAITGLLLELFLAVVNVASIIPCIGGISEALAILLGQIILDSLYAHRVLFF